MFVSGDWGLAIDIIHLLDDHSEGSKATYGYVFTKYILGVDIAPLLDSYKFAATHGDEMPYVFGYPFVTDELLSYYRGMYSMATVIRTSIGSLKFV